VRTALEDTVDIDQIASDLMYEDALEQARLLKEKTFLYISNTGNEDGE
jgi:hypothetical protein